MKKITIGAFVLMLVLPLFVLSVSAKEKGAKGEAAAKHPETIMGIVKEIDQTQKTMKVEVMVTTKYYSPKKNVQVRESVFDKKELVFDISGAKLKNYKGISDIKKNDHVKIKFEKKGEKYIAEIIRLLTGKG